MFTLKYILIFQYFKSILYNYFCFKKKRKKKKEKDNAFGDRSKVW